MNKLLITPPATTAVSVDAMRRAARASGTSLDAELLTKIQGITEEVEHKLGRALVHQTWSVALDAFPVGAIRLPMARLVSIDHVKYHDPDGVERILDPQDYQLDTRSEPGFIVPAPLHTWPATAPIVNAVEVQYLCGYGENESSVPAAIKDYILGMLENHYYPNDNVKYLQRRLDRFKVYG